MGVHAWPLQVPSEPWTPPRSRSAVLAATLKELLADDMIQRRSYDEIPPRVEYALSEKGRSVIPILQSICQWAGGYYKEEEAHAMTQCQKCDYH